MKAMSTLAGLLGLTCMFAAAAAPPSQPVSPQQQAIEAVAARMGAAAKVHDAKGFMEAYARGPDLVFVLNGEVIHGWDALYAQQLKWWDNGKSDVRYTRAGPVEFMTLAPGVVVVTRSLNSVRTLSNGKLSKGSFAVTAIWKKLPVGWRIVYGHESWTR